jgi:hypothetical protein
MICQNQPVALRLWFATIPEIVLTRIQAPKTMSATPHQSIYIYQIFTAGGVLQ